MPYARALRLGADPGRPNQHGAAHGLGNAICSCPTSGRRPRPTQPTWSRTRAGKCHMLVPYVWAQTPADPTNMEPHTGWEMPYARALRLGADPGRPNQHGAAHE